VTRPRPGAIWSAVSGLPIGEEFPVVSPGSATHLSCPNRRKHACEIKLRKFSIIRTGLGNLAAEQIGAASARPIPALPITVLVQVSGDLLRAAALPPEGWRYRDRDRNMLKTMAICPEW